MKRRITFITGHYGSGKSEVALNLSLLKDIDYLIDLDIVNPYFRSREAEQTLKKHNIKLIASPLANASGSDLPYIDKEILLPFIKTKASAIYDLGGSIIGSRLLHQFKNYLDKEIIDLFFCVNLLRPETDSYPKILATIKSIEMETDLKITGLINNTNLLKNTTCSDIKFGQDVLLQVSNTLNVPIVYTCGLDEVIDKCNSLLGEKVALKLMLRKDWL